MFYFIIIKKLHTNSSGCGEESSLWSPTQVGERSRKPTWGPVMWSYQEDGASDRSGASRDGEKTRDGVQIILKAES